MLQVKDINARAGISEAIVLSTSTTDDAAFSLDSTTDMALDCGASRVPGIGLGLDFDLLPKRPSAVLKLFGRMVKGRHRQRQRRR